MIKFEKRKIKIKWKKIKLKYNFNIILWIIWFDLTMRWNDKIKENFEIWKFEKKKNEMKC